MGKRPNSLRPHKKSKGSPKTKKRLEIKKEMLASRKKKSAKK